MRPVLIHDVYVALHQQVDGPGVLRFDASILVVTFFVVHALHVGAARHKRGRDRAAHQHTVGVDRQPVFGVLVAEVLVFQHGPGFFERGLFQAIQQRVGYFGAAIGETLALPLGRKHEEVGLGDLLGVGGRRQAQ